MEPRKTITHAGEIDLAGIKLPCFVLEDGTRILSSRGLQTALNLVEEDRESAPQQPGKRLARFLGYERLKPFFYRNIEDKSKDLFEPVTAFYKSRRIVGYEAHVLVEICDAMLEARAQGMFESPKFKRQRIVAEQCEILTRALARVGIVALVDEATGYQYDRERDELQKILKAYIGEELLTWRKRFPDEFYREIFRLNGWDFTVKGIKQRPGIIGTWTKQFIYAPMPKGILPALIKKTPKSGGKLKEKLHQSLTEDTGIPHLEKQLVSVVTLMNISQDWKEFKRFFERKFGQQVLDFGDKDPGPAKLPNDFDIALTGLLLVPPLPKSDKDLGLADSEEEGTSAEEEKEDE